MGFDTFRFYIILIKKNKRTMQIKNLCIQYNIFLICIVSLNDQMVIINIVVGIRPQDNILRPRDKIFKV